MPLRMITALLLYVSSPSMARRATVVQRTLVAAAVLAALLAIPQHAIGQSDPSATLTGKVVDTTGAAIADATVTLEGLDTPGRLVATTDSSGDYLIRQIDPGRYQVRAEADGFAPTTRELRILTGSRPSIVVQLNVAPLTEAVDVVAQPLPAVDRASPFQRIVVPGELQRSVVVTKSRDWSDVFALAPGAVSVEVNTAIGNQYSYYGAPKSSNTIRVDGLQLDSAFINGALQLSTAAIRETEIRSGVSDATAPLGLGAIVNVVTDSGIDKLRVRSEYTHLPSRWNSSNVQGGTSASANLRQVDLTAGGPIVPRSAWAFGSYRYSQSTTDIARTPEQLDLLRRLASNYQPVSTDTDAHFVLLKGQYSPAAGHQFGVLFNRDKRQQLAASVTRVERSSLVSGGHAAGAFMRSAWTSRLATSLTASWSDKNSVNSNEAASGDPKVRVFRSALSSGGVLVGDSLLAELGPARPSIVTEPNTEVVVNASAQYIANAFGTHDIRSGIDVTPSKSYTLGQQFLPNVAQVDAALLPDSRLRLFSRQIYTQRDFIASDIEGSQFGLFLQDTWKARESLTLSLGVRADRVRLEDRIARLEIIDGWLLGPRLGAAWSIDSSADWLLRLNGGRVHESLANNRISLGSISPGFRTEYDVNGDGTFETMRETPSTAGVAPGRSVMDGGVSQPFVDELAATIERRVHALGTVSLGLKRRWFKDRFVYLETNRLYDGRRFVGYSNESVRDLFVATNNEWNTPVVTNLDVVVQRDARPISFLVSYARQWRRLDGTWEPDDIAGILQPESFADTKGIGSTLGFPQDRDSFAAASGEGGEEWRDHTAKVVGNVHFPFGISTGVLYSWQSGLWSGPILRTLAGPDPSVGPPSVQLGNGTVVSNPLTTLFRFAGQTRGDGQFRYPYLHTLNLRAIREGRVGGQRWAVGVEVLNVANWGREQRAFARSTIIQGSPDFGKTALAQRPRAAILVLQTSF